MSNSIICGRNLKRNKEISSIIFFLFWSIDQAEDFHIKVGMAKKCFFKTTNKKRENVDKIFQGATKWEFFLILRLRVMHRLNNSVSPLKVRQNANLHDN